MTAAWARDWIDWEALGVIATVVLTVVLIWLAATGNKINAKLRDLVRAESRRTLAQVIVSPFTVRDESLVRHLFADAINLGRDADVVVSVDWAPDNGTETGVIFATSEEELIAAVEGGKPVPVVIAGRSSRRLLLHFPELERLSDMDPAVAKTGTLTFVTASADLSYALEFRARKDGTIRVTAEMGREHRHH